MRSMITSPRENRPHDSTGHLHLDAIDRIAVQFTSAYTEYVAATAEFGTPAIAGRADA